MCSYVDQYFPRIAALPLRERYSQAELLTNDFLIDEENQLKPGYFIRLSAGDT